MWAPKHKRKRVHVEVLEEKRKAQANEGKLYKLLHFFFPLQQTMQMMAKWDEHRVTVEKTKQPRTCWLKQCRKLPYLLFKFLFYI